MSLALFDPASKIAKRVRCVRGAFLSDVRGGFLSDVRGTIAVMFALLSVPILAAVFFSIDYSRATSHKSILQNAADV